MTAQEREIGKITEAMKNMAQDICEIKADVKEIIGNCNNRRREIDEIRRDVDEVAEDKVVFNRQKKEQVKQLWAVALAFIGAALAWAPKLLQWW